MADPFVCPRCGAVSHHPTDRAEGYCGRCHDWTTTRPALAESVRLGLLPPPWFVPVEAPACGATIEGIAGPGQPPPRFVCDKAAGHDGKCRQVTDNTAGRAVEWEYTDG